MRTDTDPTALRVLDLSDELAFQGARLLVGTGADVVRIEPGTGLGPAARTHWHAGKRLRPVHGAAELDELAAGADIVLESGPLARLRGLREDGCSRWPGAVHVVVTPFGLTGPRRDWVGDDLVLASAGGMTWLGGRPGGQPTPPPREQALQTAGAHAAMGALLGIVSGTPQLVDISVQEAVAATLETAALAWIHAGRFPVRSAGVYEHVAHRIFEAADGHVAGGYSGSDRMWTDLLAWMAERGEAGDLLDERWQDPAFRWAGRAHVDELVRRFAAGMPAAELAAEARRRALPWAEVVPPERLTANPQLRDREFLVTVTGEGLPDAGVVDVGFPWAALPRPVTLPALHEAVGEAPWREPARIRDRGRRSKARATDGQPAADTPADRPKSRALEGVRVLDLTWVLAGPYVTKQLGEHGADIVKIESRHRQDPTRFAPSMHLRPGSDPDDSGYFLNFNRNKRGVALNLRTEEGRRLLRDLVPHCDVIVENFSPGVLARWGMDYASLRALNPDVILVSMAGVGQTGPWRNAVTFADTLAAMSGLSSETREPGGPPQGLTFGLGDMIAANSAVLATLDLLARGHGGHVDLSQLEAMAAAMGPAALEGVLGTGAPDPRTAGFPNRSPHAVPHGVYPAAGDDRWVAVAALDEAQWRALSQVAELPYSESDLIGRRAHEDDIDAALAAWTRGQDAHKLAGFLQAEGVAAAVVATGQDLVEADEQLAARDFYPVLDHPLTGPVPHEGIVARLSATPGGLDRPAPLLGQHTHEVLRELLGLDDEQLAALTAEGVTE
ncbi:CoA transferase [Streptomyces sp. TRM66268-LWL]|uniref:CoA transferase n=1 Tax=Streptomyces polyasparticus TaxID=2767826 RepID=A0ABR7SCS3_9ACTN|nr:CoA transferase [Streptomyces polyasparticus]MBC9713223.1 CoA transferase [Streptomyces polyasparticus]